MSSSNQPTQVLTVLPSQNKIHSHASVAASLFQQRDGRMLVRWRTHSTRLEALRGSGSDIMILKQKSLTKLKICYADVKFEMCSNKKRTP